MFWVFDNIISNNYNFLQIFDNNLIVIDDNEIFDLTQDPAKIINLDFIKNIKPIIINYKIKVMGEYISYTNLLTNITLTFCKQEKFIEPNNNNFNKLIFDFNYNLVDNHCLPELLTKLYDNYIDNLQFEIYKLNDERLFIKEKNMANDSLRNYFITKNNN